MEAILYLSVSVAGSVDDFRGAVDSRGGVDVTGSAVDGVLEVKNSASDLLTLMTEI